MSITVILIIVFAVAMMVGPVFMMQPSKRQQHLASTRTAAAKLGLTVRLSDLGKRKRLAVYKLGWLHDQEKTDMKYCGPTLTLERLDYIHGMHLAEYWSFASPEKDLDDRLRSIVEHHLKSLPASIVGLDINPGGVGLYWLEREGEAFLPQLKASINDLRDELNPVVFNR